MKKIVWIMCFFVSFQNISLSQQISQLIEKLHSPFSFERNSAIIQLGQITNKETIIKNHIPQTLVEIIKSPTENPRVKNAAVSALYNLTLNGIDTLVVLKDILEILKDPEIPETLKIRVIKLVCVMANPKKYSYNKIFSILHQFISDKHTSPAIVAEAIEGAAKIGDKRFFGVIAKHIDSKNDKIRAAAIKAIGEFAKKGVNIRKQLKTIIKVFPKIHEKEIILSLLKVFSEIELPEKEEKKIKPLILKYMKTQDEEIMFAAILCAKKMGLKGVPEFLIKRIKEPSEDPNTPVKLAYILGDYINILKKEKDKQELIQRIVDTFVDIILNTKDKSLLIAAAWALGDSPMSVDRTKAFLALVKLLKERDIDIVNTAINSLEAMTGQMYGNDLKKWKYWWQKNKDILMANS